MTDFALFRPPPSGRNPVRAGLAVLSLLGVGALAPTGALAQATCANTVTARVAAIDTAISFNRLGAQNVNFMTYALVGDLVDLSDVPCDNGGACSAGNVKMRPDKRPRPLVLRVPAESCLAVSFTNWLNPVPNPIPNPQNALRPELNEDPAVLVKDDQIASRYAGFHPQGMELVGDIASDSSNVGTNANSLANVGETKTYTFYAKAEGSFLVTSYGGTFGGEGSGGNVGVGLFGQVNVQPVGARMYRTAVTEEDMRLAADADFNGVLEGAELTADGHPIINYEAVYPNVSPWIEEGKAGDPILRMTTDVGNVTGPASGEIVHSDLEAIVVGPEPDGSFPAGTYTNLPPSMPNRLEPFRDYAQVWHDETAATQAFPAFFADTQLGFAHVLKGVRDAFMINYGSGGIGSEIIANRLHVGPMHDCLSCTYEEFFLSSYTVGDPAVLVNMPANTGNEACTPLDAATLLNPSLNLGGNPANCRVGPLTEVNGNYPLYPDDPANIDHAYQRDFIKFRNVHAGPKEQHVFHLHQHQWLFDPNDDNANYLDAQGIGPGSSYTYEIANGGAGNRNVSAGDAIFHCHFYPHFAQGMWYHLRIQDTFETGTVLAATPNDGNGNPSGYHATPWALANGTPAPNSRALPDGELLAGVPIPAVVPMPGKPMAPMPGKVVVVAKDSDGDTIPDSSQAKVIERDKNPGYPFWIAGIDCGPAADPDGDGAVSRVDCPTGIVGQRPTTPPLDMLTDAEASALATDADPLFNDSPGFATNAGGWDGGLPRSTLDGYKAVADLCNILNYPAEGGCAEINLSRLDLTKIVHTADAVMFPEEGTDLEHQAMAFHSHRNANDKPYHDTFRLLPSATGGVAAPVNAANPITLARSVYEGYRVNGAPPQPSAPYFEPCNDDEGTPFLTGNTGRFFSGDGFSTLALEGIPEFGADAPRKYAGAHVQVDAVFNKVGYHFPQQRIEVLWRDVMDTINQIKPPEPFVMRLNTFDCAVFKHANLVPEVYHLDEYQVKTPTDIIGQHIHLPKWDLPSADGAGNGWNYEDGTLSPGAVRERIVSINHAAELRGGAPLFAPETHPFFGNGPGGDTQNWLGARTTLQRWFSDPLVNNDLEHRGLGIIFTHDHYGPSTHQQMGLYATVLVEPPRSEWVHNETGQPLGTQDPVTGPGGGSEIDGGPTSWQAAILPAAAPGAPVAGNGTVGIGPHREFYLEFSDFQGAYELGRSAGVVGGTNFNVALPIAVTANGNDFPTDSVPPLPVDPANATFRFTINASFRQEALPVIPDLITWPPHCGLLGGNFTRPCPEAISVDDPGMLVVNYRQEPVGLRVFDPARPANDGKLGNQTLGDAGDLAFALQSRQDRAIAALNTRLGNTPYPAVGSGDGINRDRRPGDPFTPTMRTYAGDTVKVKIQAGGHEHEHNATIHGVKWLQGGSGFGSSPNSGWRNAQNDGISEQFTFTAPLVTQLAQQQGASADYAWSVNAAQDGWWSGMWGLIRAYNNPQQQRDALFQLPNNPLPIQIGNRNQFAGVCPRGQGGQPANLREFDITAVLANDVLPQRFLANGGPVTILPAAEVRNGALVDFTQFPGGAVPDPAGGTLVYNSRETRLVDVVAAEPGAPAPGPDRFGPLHDPTAILYVRTADLVAMDPADPGCLDANGQFDQNLLTCPVRLVDNAPVEPLVLRANAGDCIEVTLRNRLPDDVDLNGFLDDVPDLAGYMSLIQVVQRDRGATAQQGLTTFQNNLIRPSSRVGLHPQLVAYDVTRSDGVVVGQNPADRQAIATPGGLARYQWYAGDISAARQGGRINLVATPVEFGGANLTPTDKIKQGQKSLVGALVIEPAGATWPEDDRNGVTNLAELEDRSGVDPNANPAGPARKTRAMATVTKADASTFRDLVPVLQKAHNHRYADGTPIQQIAAEGGVVPEDTVDTGQMAVNYGTEPPWFRFGLQPQVPFELLRDVPTAWQLYSNTCCGAGGIAPGSTVNTDPQTPVFVAFADNVLDETRFRLLYPTGIGRSSTFNLHGHLWQRAPYQSGAVASQTIAFNPNSMYLGGQESVAPNSHFDVVVDAGGTFDVTGDYLFRGHDSFGNMGGVWGILRVQ